MKITKDVAVIAFSFTNEDAFGEGLCCENEGGTVCWGYCKKHKFKHRKRGKYER